MKSGSLARAALALAVAPLPAAAQPDTLVVTASRTAPLQALGGSVIERDQIRTLQPPTMLEALDRVAGVRAFAKGGVGGPTYLAVRGGEPNFTLVLLEGIKLGDPTNSQGGAFDLAQLDPQLVERVEISRGALSAVHGADALAGAVNLALRRPEPGERALSSRALGSTEGEVGADLALGAGWSGGGLLLGGAIYDSGDLDPASDLFRAQALSRLVHSAGGINLSALALLATTDRSAFPEDSGGPRLAVIRDRESRETDLTVLGATLALTGGPALEPRLRLNWSRQDADIDTPAIAPGAIEGVPAITSITRFDRLEAGVDLTHASDPVTLAAGAAYLEEDGSGEGTVDLGSPLPADFSLGRQIWSAYAEATIEPLPEISATASVRYDDPSTHGAQTTARAALRASPFAGGPALLFSYAEGFKLPSLYALAYPLIANPELRPERARTLELGVSQMFGPARLALTGFHTRYTDLIDFDAERFTNVNRARVNAQGVEAELNAPLTRTLSLNANATLLDVDNADGPPLRSRPEWQGQARLDWRPDETLSGFLTASYVDDQFDSSVPTGLVRLESRWVIDAGLTVPVSERLTLQLTGRNLLSEDYEDSIGTPAPGRTLRASLRLAL